MQFILFPCFSKKPLISRLRTSLIVLLLFAQWQAVVEACPFCAAISQTFTEEMKMMDVAVIATMKSRVRTRSSEPGVGTRSIESSLQAEVPRTIFEITEVLKGKGHFKVGDTFTAIYLGALEEDSSFLLMATDAPNFMWSSPLRVTDRAKSYLMKLSELPSGPERLVFFQDYLGDEDETLARDAYDEFAIAPYADLVSIKSKMKRQQLVDFINDPDVRLRHRKLYFTMLSVCGTREDARLLEQFMLSDDLDARAGLDAMLACYVTLMGEPGLDKVDELFLKNVDAEYTDTNAAIIAIRFHASDTDRIPRERLLKSLRHMLRRPELADLVIADLAKWEDWSVVSTLCDLFITADEDSSFVRGPVIRYLQACPFPIAKDKIEELRLVDADAVESALAYADSSESNPELAAPIQPTPLKPVQLAASNGSPKKAPVASPVSALQRPNAAAGNDTAHDISMRTTDRNSPEAKVTSRLPMFVATVVCFGIVVLFLVSRRNPNPISRN